MNERDDLFELYQAFHLGLLVGATLRSEQFDTRQHLRPALDVLRQVGMSEATIHDPQTEASKSPAIAPLIAQTASLVFQTHRELAAKILRGKESQFQVRTVDPRS